MSHDEATLSALLAETAWMQGLARRLLGDSDAADDVVQETWLNALRVPPVRGSTLRPWLATVMRNLVRSRRRRDARARARETQFAATEASAAVEEVLARRQTERLLAGLVLALDEPYRRTVLQRFHDGLSAADIARAEGTPEGTVRWRLKHALDELRRHFVGDDQSDRTALAALLPLAGPVPSAPDPISVPLQWFGQTAAAKGTAVLTAAGAVTAVAVVAVLGVREPHLQTRVRESAAPVVAVAVPPEVNRPSLPVASSPEAIPAAPDPVPPLAPAPRSVANTPTKIPVIVGIVRDSRGDPAVHVPVTIRTLSGSGAAERTTTTDEAGRFRLPLRARSRFVLTAELKNEPAARIAIDVPSDSAISVDDGAAHAGVNGSTIEVALDTAIERTTPALAKARQARDFSLSRWCCRQAFSDQDLVYGRGCLKFDDGESEGQTGCELYGLKAQVSCQRFTRGGLSTGDLSRTEQLACNGRLM